MTPNKDEKDMINDIQEIIKKNIEVSRADEPLGCCIVNSYDLSRLIVDSISPYIEKQYEKGYSDGENSNDGAIQSSYQDGYDDGYSDGKFYAKNEK